MKPLLIGQIAEATGVSVETVRYYEQRGLLARPQRTASRYRQYQPDTVQRLQFILRAKDHGFSLKEIKALLDSHDDESATRAEVCQTIDDKIAALEAQIRQLHQAQESLARLRGLCRDKGPACDCPILLALGCPAPEERPDTMPARLAEIAR